MCYGCPFKILILGTWASYVDLSRTLYFDINCINKSKHQYNALELRHVCNNHVKNYYYDFYQLYTDDGSKDK